jgi:hypothetical protein
MSNIKYSKLFSPPPLEEVGRRLLLTKNYCAIVVNQYFPFDVLVYGF